MILLNPDRILIWQCAIIAVLVIGHAAGMPLQASADGTVVKFFHQYLDLNSEGTPASYYSALAFLATALVAGHLATKTGQGPQRRFWAIAALLLAFFSLDEAASIHEGFVVVGRQFVPQEGIFFFTWWAPYLMALTPVVALLLPGLLQLPRHTRVGLIVAGGVFLSGALGLELIESGIADKWLSAAPGSPEAMRNKLNFSGLVMVEECIEMIAVALTLRTLTIHAANTAPEVRLVVAHAAARPASPPAQGIERPHIAP